MKKTLWLLVLLGLVLSGCSEDGTLRITNYSNYDVWFDLGGGSQTTLTFFGQVYEKDYTLSTSIFGDEDKRITVNYGGEFVFSNSVSKTIKPGSTARVDIFSDAGEIIIWNDSYGFYIEEVYLSLSNDTTWGTNDLSGYIGPNEYVSWLVTPGWWDLLIIDDWGDEFYSFDNYISLEETVVFYYDGFKSGGDSVQLKIENAKKYTEITEDRVQQNEK
jgi:hypothetical protein